ncbi:MAG: sigma-70 family RNA polymerase sigma factor [Thermoguttaceae bacterium]|jgi:RNA polymerase sigma-70 factor (ECF subfamily)
MTNAGNDLLLRGLAAGDERAFAALYDQYGTRLYRTAYGILGHREDAEDAVQEVFTALIRSHKTLGDVKDLTAYLFSALRRAAARCAERRKREPASSPAVQDIEAKTEPKQTNHPSADRLEQALQKLPEEQREVISLKIDGQLTFNQIAEVLGISINTAASRYRYALEKLRETLL